MSMNLEIKKLWVEDLLANPDLQGQERLFDGEKYCCLGRLCELHRIHSKEGGIWEANSDENEFVYAPNLDTQPLIDGGRVIAFRSSAKSLPAAVVTWAGLDRCNPVIGEDGEEFETIASANDGGVPFSEIAQIIDRKL